MGSCQTIASNSKVFMRWKKRSVGQAFIWKYHVEDAGEDPLKSFAYGDVYIGVKFDQTKLLDIVSPGKEKSPQIMKS